MPQTRDSVRPDGLIARLNPRASDCFSCARRSSCLAGDLNDGQLADYNSRIQQNQTYQPGDPVFTMGEPFQGMYIVKSGFFESYSVTEDGNSKVTGFYIAGDIFGLESIGEGGHTYTTEALSVGSACLVPLSLLRENSETGLALLHKMLELMGRIILSDRALIYSLATMNASQRIATFLVNLTTRMEHAGFRKGELVLHMHRIDIGSYLGLAEETVSRVFSRFHDRGILRIRRRYIKHYDLDGLRAIARGDIQC
ncbi:helix-turn-helix domain-containing protein [Marinobacter sp. HL-58]|uniref:helix-turn-helix domain-containing protein n=1 Tax=Marinobacter sp. HL-58 TaxID=1479237 RepID=UPI0006D95144|nr:helix-turn-helix domain-containing protein [Marinobacter sp. HL-58]KPP98897.1 MAG: Crp/Fnr family transcriptional regulator [Marinobacter sp. HL-58]